MDILSVTVPLFDRFMSAEAYLLRVFSASQEDYLTRETALSFVRMLKPEALEVLSGGKPVFVPVDARLLPGLVLSFPQEMNNIIYLLCNLPAAPSEEYLQDLQKLKETGCRFALQQQRGYIASDALLVLADHVFFDTAAMQKDDRRAHILRYKNDHKHLQLVATALQDTEVFRQALQDGFHFFEGRFYRLPAERCERELSPIKANLVHLLNSVRDEDFEFKNIANIIRRDPALSYSLMRFINSPYLGIRHKVKSIQHAVTILGQIEMRKWVAAAVFKSLGSGRVNELTRISLVRAKFAENLAEIFRLQEEASSLFLMGMFSTLDAMLETSMEQALSQVWVSDEISDALIKKTGPYQPVLQAILDYEQADWDGVMAVCASYDQTPKDYFSAYCGALGWYLES